MMPEETEAMYSETPAPEGYHREWLPDEGWKLADLERTCRAKDCESPAVAALRRKHGDGFRWWYYCGSHLYGRKIEDGMVKVYRLVKDERLVTRR